MTIFFQNNASVHTSSVKSRISNRALNRPVLLSASSSTPSISAKVDPSKLLEAALLVASNIAVRAKVDLLFAVTVDGPEVADPNGEGMLVNSFGSSFSDKLFRLRGTTGCRLVAESNITSVNCSQSDCERDCFSILMVDGFREEDRSSASVDTNG